MRRCKHRARKSTSTNVSSKKSFIWMTLNEKKFYKFIQEMNSKVPPILLKAELTVLFGHLASLSCLCVLMGIPFARKHEKWYGSPHMTKDCIFCFFNLWNFFDVWKFWEILNEIGLKNLRIDLNDPQNVLRGLTDGQERLNSKCIADGSMDQRTDGLMDQHSDFFGKSFMKLAWET